MSSPRLYDPDYVIDAVEQLVAQHGTDALTIRALTKATGVSNGAIYRTFESRGGLLGRARIRAERRFLSLLAGAVDEAHERSAADPREAVHAAAETSLIYPEMYPGSAALLLTVGRNEVVTQPMPRDVADQLAALQRELAALITQLAQRLWGRGDDDAVDLVATCIVDLPKWIAVRGKRYSMPVMRDYLRAAVRSVLSVGPPTNAGRELVAVGGHQRGVGAASASSTVA
ncbi:TetR/AcrR family transcriptional regulator [Mycobacterium sp. 1423905.2]|uniref:TetR/AcrR family transcriptional regulator n=1 Tax=Mycobacterium sp. 1423905.2 TaxID=1856859 RepID=UPI000A72BA8C|nr:TetR/AcrR family transcriptional regulator [Mycobacterium sp. 1423905.2]